MSFFKKPCSNCGKRTHRVQTDGSPFCGDCWRLELQEKASAEETRACPDDGTTMVKEIVRDAFIIDRCPSCGGVWLDCKDIDLMKQFIAFEKKIPSEYKFGFYLTTRSASAIIIRDIVGPSN